MVHQLVVFYWRGAWEVLDTYLYPDDKLMSAIVSYVIACILQLIVCIAQPFLNALYAYRPPDSRLTLTKQSPFSVLLSVTVRRWFLETVMYLLVNFVSVSHWRGIWMLLDLYVFPDQPDLSAGLTHVVGIVGLWLLWVGHSVTLGGCSIDGGSTPEQGCIVGNQYIQWFVEQRRKAHLDSLARETSNGNIQPTIG